MNESRLKILDRLLRKGWCSYLDIAKEYLKTIEPYTAKEAKSRYGLTFTINSNEERKQMSVNRQLLDAFRSAIGQDFLDIVDIRALVYENKVLIRDYGKSKKLSKEEKNKRKKLLEADRKERGKIREEIFEEKSKSQYGVLSAKPKKETDLSYDLYDRLDREGKIDIGRVTFYRYKDRKYSVFDSGDFKKYREIKEKIALRKSLEGATETATKDIKVRSVLHEPDVILETGVSEKVKQRIRIENELKETEQEVREIIARLKKEIALLEDNKKKDWIKKTVNYYKNILELAKSPISNVDKRELAGHIHDFAFFLASENQYQLLDGRFEEAIGIYQRLMLVEKHRLEDHLAGENLFEAEEFDIEKATRQLAEDRDMVAGALLHYSRVLFDSHDVEKATSYIDRALEIANPGSAAEARLMQLKAIISSVRLDIESASEWMEKAYLRAGNAEIDMAELAEITTSYAEIKRAEGDLQRAVELYNDAVAIFRETGQREGIAAAQMGIAMIYLTAGMGNEAETAISESVALFQELYSLEPERHLPGYMAAVLVFMMILQGKGETEIAIEIGKDAMKAYEKGNETLRSLCGQEFTQIQMLLKELQGHGY